MSVLYAADPGAPTARAANRRQPSPAAAVVSPSPRHRLARAAAAARLRAMRLISLHRDVARRRDAVRRAAWAARRRGRPRTRAARCPDRRDRQPHACAALSDLAWVVPSPPAGQCAARPELLLALAEHHRVDVLGMGVFARLGLYARVQVGGEVRGGARLELGRARRGPSIVDGAPWRASSRKSSVSARTNSRSVEPCLQRNACEPGARWHRAAQQALVQRGWRARAGQRTMSATLYIQ